MGSNCTLVVGNSYCVEENFGVSPPVTSTSALSSTSTPTPTGNGITTPTPTQTGMVSNCNAFHKVVSGDQCGTIASTAGISLDNFYAWNPAVGTTCQYLYLDYYVCIGVIGMTASSTPTANSTPTGNGISTPTPTQTSMVSNCNSFHLVVSSDECGTIASSAGIPLESFYAWNPAVGASCGSLWAGYYVCVGTTTYTATITTTTSTKVSTSTNGITTPTPTQTGMVNSCNKFYLVSSSDTCASIASTYSVTLSAFYTWNPAIGTSCGSLWTGYYVCVGVISGSGKVSSTLATSTTNIATTTTKGNGVTTPTPYQAGMTTSCKTFHLVVSGDTCSAIASNAGITLSNFYAWNTGVGSSCQTLYLGYYVCIAVL